MGGNLELSSENWGSGEHDDDDDDYDDDPSMNMTMRERKMREGALSCPRKTGSGRMVIDNTKKPGASIKQSCPGVFLQEPYDQPDHLCQGHFIGH